MIYGVTLQNGQAVNLREANLQAVVRGTQGAFATAGANGGGAASEADFSSGDAVTLCGLQNAAHLNGAVGNSDFATVERHAYFRNYCALTHGLRLPLAEGYSAVNGCAGKEICRL